MSTSNKPLKTMKRIKVIKKETAAEPDDAAQKLAKTSSQKAQAESGVTVSGGAESAPHLGSSNSDIRTLDESITLCPNRGLTERTSVHEGMTLCASRGLTERTPVHEGMTLCASRGLTERTPVHEGMTLCPNRGVGGASETSDDATSVPKKPVKRIIKRIAKTTTTQTHDSTVTETVEHIISTPVPEPGGNVTTSSSKVVTYGNFDDDDFNFILPSANNTGADIELGDIDSILRNVLGRDNKHYPGLEECEEDCDDLDDELALMLGIEKKEKTKSNILERVGARATYTLADCISVSSAGKKLRVNRSFKKTIAKTNVPTEEFPQIGKQKRNLRQTSDYSDSNIFDLLETVEETINYSRTLIERLAEDRKTSIIQRHTACVPHAHFKDVQKTFSVTRLKLERMTITRILANLHNLTDACNEEEMTRLEGLLKKNELIERARVIDLFFEAYNLLMTLRLYFRECIESIIPVADRVYDAYAESDSRINKTFDTNSVVEECDGLILCKPEELTALMLELLDNSRFTSPVLAECRDLPAILYHLEKLLKLPIQPFTEYSELRKETSGVLARIDRIVGEITAKTDKDLSYVRYLITIQNTPSQVLDAKGIVSWTYLPLEPVHRPVTIDHTCHLYPVGGEYQGFDEYSFMEFLFGLVSVNSDGFIQLRSGGLSHSYLYLVSDTIPRYARGIKLISKESGHQLFCSMIPGKRVSDQRRQQKKRDQLFVNELAKRTRERCQQISEDDAEVSTEIKRVIEIELRAEIYGIIPEDEKPPLTPPEKDIDELFYGMIGWSDDSEGCRHELERLDGRFIGQRIRYHHIPDLSRLTDGAAPLSWSI